MEGDQTPIQPGRASASGGGPPGAFQGTVTGVKRDGGAQTVEIQSAQGRIRLQAEGEFQLGEKVRVSMSQGGGVRLEKAALPAEQPPPGEGKGVSYTLPGNLVTMKGLRAFEEGLVRWVASRPPGQPDPAAAGKGGPGGSEVESLLRLPLPELLKRVLSREGGRDTLAQALAGLGREAFAALMEGLEDGAGSSAGPADTGKASVLQLLRALRREAEDPAAAQAQGGARGAGASAPGLAPGETGRSSASRDLGAFWPPGPPRPAGPGADASAQPWMGRVLTREDPGTALSFAGGKPLPPPKTGGEVPPLFRYLLDLGGRTLALQSPQLRQPGDFVDFEMEAPAGGPQGGRLQARFLDPAQALPPGLKAAFAQADAQGRAGLQVAARTLAEFQGEPFHEELVKDFAAVLAQGGRLDPAAGGGPRAGQLPSRQEVDTLLRLFVAFPRDGEAPERQARVWAEAARDPKALQELLKGLGMKPEAETSLLRPATPLRLMGMADLAGRAGIPAELAAALLPGGDKPEEALAALLRRVLPEGFKAPDLADLARQAALPGADGKDAQSARLLMQAFAGLVPREEEMREGRPAQFYHYQGQDWRGLQVTWERDRERGARERRDKDAPLKMRVETQAKLMGKVDVGAVVQGDRLTLDFRNQFHDVRELLAAELPELERGLALLGFRVDAWTYARMEEAPQAPPTAGWVRPASLDGGNLDLTG